MESFRVRGTKKIKGALAVAGSKNSALPILSACLLTTERCEIRNVPKIHDVLVFLDLIKSVGAEVSWEGETLVIQAKHIDPAKIDMQLVKRMRGSLLLVGSLLARTKSLAIPYPGGCNIGARPLDAHFSGLRDLGAIIEERDGEFRITMNEYKGGRAVLPEFSVTATENLLLLASFFDATTTLRMCAAEPSVTELAVFLKKMGADIRGEGTHDITVRGTRAPRGAQHTIWPDPIEAGTFIVTGLLAGELAIRNVPVDFLDMMFQKLKEMNAHVVIKKRDMILDGYASAEVLVKSRESLRPTKIQTLPYPGFPTDLQPVFCVLATQAHGTTVIEEYLYEGRFRYIDELKKMGANATIVDEHRVFITGPTPFYGGEVTAHDLRSGAALLLASLLASNETTIHNIGQIDRGYERMEERLRSVGADIRRISNS